MVRQDAGCPRVARDAPRRNRYYDAAPGERGPASANLQSQYLARSKPQRAVGAMPAVARQQARSRLASFGQLEQLSSDESDDVEEEAAHASEVQALDLKVWDEFIGPPGRRCCALGQYFGGASLGSLVGPYSCWGNPQADTPDSVLSLDVGGLSARCAPCVRWSLRSWLRAR